MGWGIFSSFECRAAIGRPAEGTKHMAIDKLIIDLIFTTDPQVHARTIAQVRDLLADCLARPPMEDTPLLPSPVSDMIESSENEPGGEDHEHTR